MLQTPQGLGPALRPSSVGAQAAVTNTRKSSFMLGWPVLWALHHLGQGLKQHGMIGGCGNLRHMSHLRGDGHSAAAKHHHVKQEASCCQMFSAFERSQGSGDLGELSQLFKVGN